MVSLGMARPAGNGETRKVACQAERSKPVRFQHRDAAGRYLRARSAFPFPAGHIRLLPRRLEAVIFRSQKRLGGGKAHEIP